MREDREENRERVNGGEGAKKKACEKTRDERKEEEQTE